MIRRLKITKDHIPQHRTDNPICLALYRGITYTRGPDYFYGNYQGKVKFDVINQCYWIWTGEYGRPSMKAGKLLQAWLSAWNHGKAVSVPVIINFIENTAEVECEDRGTFLSFWNDVESDVGP